MILFKQADRENVYVYVSSIYTQDVRIFFQIEDLSFCFSFNQMIDLLTKELRLFDYEEGLREILFNPDSYVSYTKQCDDNNEKVFTIWFEKHDMESLQPLDGRFCKIEIKKGSKIRLMSLDMEDFIFLHSQLIEFVEQFIDPEDIPSWKEFGGKSFEWAFEENCWQLERCKDPEKNCVKYIHNIWENIQLKDSDQ